jgi:tetrahydrodipicolinate N-succinyltransferase
MKIEKKLGICMDHANAHLIEFSDGVKPKETISLDFDNQDKDETLQRSESEMHNKQQQRKNAYYKKLATVIKDFTEVVLFGATNAKSELFNFLRQNHQFDSIKIEVINTDKMTDNQQHEFVRKHFKKFEIKNL